MSRFSPGDVILHRLPFIDDAGRTKPVITDVKPMVVVEDHDDQIALWLPAGTPTVLCRPLVPDQPRPWLEGQWELVNSRWERWNTVFLMKPGAWHATWVMWSPDWEFQGWYVNLQEPVIRTPLGFDARDLWLDMLVAPDRSWRWKDEGEVERVVKAGVVKAETMDEARAEGLRVAESISNGEPPFVDSWRTWRPNPAWPLPQLPEGDLFEMDFPIE